VDGGVGMCVCMCNCWEFRIDLALLFGASMLLLLLLDRGCVNTLQPSQVETVRE
jgi:hypothetical protein